MRFLNPSALLYGSLFAVLVALYLWERRRRIYDVPSLLLWQSIPEARVRTSRFRPDLLFWLQSLVLAMLVFGFAQPHFEGTAQNRTRRVYVLDISASMAAREGRLTRFEQAENALRNRLSEVDRTDEVMLVTAANHPTILVDFTTDRDAFLEALERVNPVDTGTNLPAALAIARRVAERGDFETTVEVFTDTPVTSDSFPEGLGVHQFGETDDNLAIDGLEVFQGRFQSPVQAEAHVVVRNYSHRDAHGFLTTSLEGKVLNRRGFTVAPRDARGFQLGDFPQSGVLQVRLEVDDALEADNAVWGWIAPTRPITAVVVSEPGPFMAQMQQIGAAVANLDFVFIRPAIFDVRGAKDADVVIFYRFVPDTPPTTPTLFLFPNRDGASFSVGGTVEKIGVSNWSDRHPALRALDPRLAYTLKRANLVSLPPWVDVLMTMTHQGREQPLAFAGESSGQRIAGVTFDIGAEEILGADNINILLLLLNLVDWLAAEDRSVAIARTGESHVIENVPNLPRKIVGPSGETQVLPPEETLRVNASRAGQYRISVNGFRRTLLANFLDPVESDIGRAAAQKFSAPEPIRPAEKKSAEGASFGFWLYGAACLLMVGEWLIAGRRA